MLKIGFIRSCYRVDGCLIGPKVETLSEMRAFLYATNYHVNRSG
jgi:hypothetical protein